MNCKAVGPVVVAAPFPINWITKGDPCAGVIVTVAVRTPREDVPGANETAISQLLRPEIVNPKAPPQLSASTKSPALAPPSLMLLI